MEVLKVNLKYTNTYKASSTKYMGTYIKIKKQNFKRLNIPLKYLT